MTRHATPHPESHPDLTRLLDLLDSAETLRAELYGQPCSRGADEPCRLPGEGAPGRRIALALDGACSSWCPACRAWWLQHQVCESLLVCVAIQRSIIRDRAALAEGRRPPQSIDLVDDDGL